MKNHKIFLIISLVLFNTAAMSVELYVNPLGNDRWSGTLRSANTQATDGPFKTLARAKQAVKTLKQNYLNEMVNVNISSGMYYLTQSLSFDVTDSGMPGKEITWKGDPGSTVVVSGGIPVTCNQPINGIWTCPLSQIPIATAFFDTGRIKGNGPKFELFVNDQRLNLARWPDQGWAHIYKAINTNSQFSAMQNLPILNGVISNAQVHIFPGSDWYDQILGLSSLDLAMNTITLSSATALNLDSGRRFFIQNSQSLMDAPGEWFYDTVNKKVMFIPPAGQVPQQVIVSSLPGLFAMNGASNINFQNLTFQHSAATALSVTNSNNIKLDTLTINNVGAHGVLIQGGSNVQVSNSNIYNTGWRGIDVSGGNRTTLAPSGHIITNNHIRDTGKILVTAADAVHVDGVGVTLSHNFLEQTPGESIRLLGNNHLIEKNEIANACTQESDCGAIYSGRDWSFRGNTIRYNYIHDVYGYGLDSVDLVHKVANYISPNSARGIYLDDAASGFDIYGNIIEKTSFAAIQIGGGRDNKIHDNFIRTTDEFAIWIDDRWSGFDWGILQTNLNAVPYKSSIWASKYPELAAAMHNYKWPEGNRIERNIFISGKANARTLGYIIPVDSTTIADNVAWNTQGSTIMVAYTLLETQKGLADNWNNWLLEGVEQGSVYANPCATLTNKVLSFCSNSPVITIGFPSIPTDIGIQ